MDDLNFNDGLLPAFGSGIYEDSRVEIEYWLASFIIITVIFSLGFAASARCSRKFSIKFLLRRHKRLSVLSIFRSSAISRLILTLPSFVALRPSIGLRSIGPIKHSLPCKRVGPPLSSVYAQNRPLSLGLGLVLALLKIYLKFRCNKFPFNVLRRAVCCILLFLSSLTSILGRSWTDNPLADHSTLRFCANWNHSWPWCGTERSR